MKSKQSLCLEKLENSKLRLPVKDLFIYPDVVRVVTNDGDIQKSLTIAGKDGDDVPRYLEKQLEQLLAELEDLGTEGDI